MLFYITALALLFLSVGCTVAAEDFIKAASPMVHLPYATYTGFHNTTSSLDVFLGIRYAAPPTGNNRWRVAQAPSDVRDQGVLNATVYPPQCPQGSSATPLETTDDEDCLFLDVYVPSGSTPQSTLPVLVWIHGGGWDHNSVQQFDPTPMINYANNSFIAVIIQYRLAAFGLLPTPTFSNGAITDVRSALQWVQRSIHLFGGDPGRVTIWGQSSGGGSILHLLAAEARSRDAPLWRSSIVSSPYLVPMGKCDTGYFKNQFRAFAAAANCTFTNATNISASTSDSFNSYDDRSLACLRQLPTNTLKTLSHTFDSVRGAGHSSAYEPCIEGEGGYLVSNTADELAQGNIAGDWAIAGSNLHDGSTFVSTSIIPPAGTTSANFSAVADSLLNSTLMADLPLTQEEILEVMNVWYPLDQFSDNHARGAQIFQDVTFACPANWIAEAKGQKGWRYLYAIGTAVHAQDNAYEFPIHYNTLAPVSPSLYATYIGAATFFIRASPPNPNTLNAPLAWPAWGTAAGSYKVLNVSATTNTSTSYIIAAGENQGWIGSKDRCAFWANTRKNGDHAAGQKSDDILMARQSFVKRNVHAQRSGYKREGRKTR
ncbi:alpha/beta-hydrolase [Athelia psychrophila]|uniref:Carboxylic ester hydrolase n=1 Tax=Athelia psychrophila TaxID=1759441 RepID=A0A167V1M8_9AGAM|nr:alpha/beta-hydrolase [Fibularhizoctonia sp. CBS 109695]